MKTKPVIRAAAILCILLFATSASAYISTSDTTITTIYSYSEYGSGDVVFRVAAPLTDCEGGFWLKRSDPGFNANLTLLLAAYQSRSTVMIYANPDQIWSGSGSKYCHLYAIQLK